MNDRAFHLNKMFLRGALLSCAAFFSTHASIRLLIIDTQGKDAYYYRNLIQLSQKAGFTVSYRSFYDFLENPTIDQCDALIFMLTPALINYAASRNSLFCTLFQKISPSLHEQCINALLSYAQQHHKALGIFLPGGIASSPWLFTQTYEVVKKLTHASLLDTNTNSFIRSFLAYAGEPDSKKGILFGTALLNKGAPTFPAITDQYKQPHTQIIDQKTEKISAQLAPIQQHRYTELVQKALPNGLLLHNSPTNGIYLISKTSEFNCSDITEHFFKTPLTLAERNELLVAQLETLQEWYQGCCNRTLSKESPEPIPLSAHLNEQNSLQAHQHKVKHDMKQLSPAYRHMIHKGISCAWLDPYDFFAHEDTHEKLKKTILAKNPTHPPETVKQAVEDLALKRGVKIIYEGNFNLLWFEFIPEWYLSLHGLRKQQREEYVSRIIKLGRALKDFFKQKGLSLPKLFVGLNLTSNFRTYPVCNPVKNIFGTTYTKIPSPLDVTHFWQPEVIDIFASFVKEFKNHLPIDGVCFDFEMYHAQDQTGSITDQMDFSDCAWRTYCTYTQNAPAAKIKRFKKRIAYLQQHKKFKDYFRVLQLAAKEIGTMLKKELRAQIPHLMFAAYAPTLPLSWCYRGIMAGLSSPTEPLLLATFNTDAISHDNWLKNHDIHILHGTAIMLSKLQHADDFKLILSDFMQHDFVWYNRPSRLIYNYTQKELDKCWWGIESNAQPVRQTMHNIRRMHRKIIDGF